MAYINISVPEVMSFADKNLNYDRDRIKSIKLINENQVEIVVSIGRMFPNVKVVLAYSGFREGSMYFNIISNGGIKIVMGLLNEFGNKSFNEYLKLDKTSIEFAINKMLSENLNGVNIRDISIMREQIYVTVDFK